MRDAGREKRPRSTPSPHDPDLASFSSQAAPSLAAIQGRQCSLVWTKAALPIHLKKQKTFDSPDEHQNIQPTYKKNSKKTKIASTKLVKSTCTTRYRVNTFYFSLLNRISLFCLLFWLMRWIKAFVRSLSLSLNSLCSLPPFALSLTLSLSLSAGFVSEALVLYRRTLSSPSPFAPPILFRAALCSRKAAAPRH